MNDWIAWHGDYDQENSPLARRLKLVQGRLREIFDNCPRGPIRLVSICAGDGRDVLGALRDHPRENDVSGRLIELDPVLVERARSAAPSTISAVQGDAGQSDAYEGAVPADVILCCGVFGHLSDLDIRRTIRAWRMLGGQGATVIWTRGWATTSMPDRRDAIRSWVTDAGFEEVFFVGSPERFGVGVARMIGDGQPLQSGARLFSFGSITEVSRSGATPK